MGDSEGAEEGSIPPFAVSVDEVKDRGTWPRWWALPPHAHTHTHPTRDLDLGTTRARPCRKRARMQMQPRLRAYTDERGDQD